MEFEPENAINKKVISLPDHFSFTHTFMVCEGVRTKIL
jgi:hypothetical protein